MEISFEQQTIADKVFQLIVTQVLLISSIRNASEGDVTRDYSQTTIYSATQRATLLRVVITLFQYCNAVLR